MRARWRIFGLLAVAALIAASATIALSGGSARHESVRAATPEEIEEAEQQEADLKTAQASSSNQLSGSVTDTGCGSSDISVDPASTINITVSSEVPSNDIAVNLVLNGQTLHNEDTGVGQETFVYPVGATGGGTYQIKVCKSPNPAAPFQPAGGPYPYDGVYTDVDVATPGTPIPAPGSTTNPTTVTPVASYGKWDATFAPATVVDPQRTEGEPVDIVTPDGTVWESGPWGTTTQQSFIHHSSNDGGEFHIVTADGLRPDAPPGGGDTDLAMDDQGTLYFVDLEALTNLGVAVSHDNGMTWTKNPAGVQQTALDRQWYAVDNGPTPSASDNTLFMGFHTSGVGTYVYSSPGSTGPNDPVGGLVWQNAGSLPGPLQPLAGDATCAKLHFDTVTRNLYMACNEGDHVRVTVGHVAIGQRTGIAFTNYTGPKTPGGGSVLGLFPGLSTDTAGNVYITWIDKSNFNVYYAFSNDQGKSWSAAVRVNTSPSATNEFDWVQAGAPGTIEVVWYGTSRVAVGGSDGMPSSLDADPGPATAYPWYGYGALITAANTAKPRVLQTRFTSKPMHYGAICNSGTTCITNPTADRQMADYFSFVNAQDGGMRIVYNDTTNESDGAGLFYARQIGGRTLLGTRLNGGGASNPVSDATGDAQYPHFSSAGVGPNLPQLDLTGVSVSQPNSATLRFTISAADLSKLVPPVGKTTPVWLVRFQALAPLENDPANVYRIFYVYMEKKANLVPQFYAGSATCQDTTPGNCKLLNYPETKAVDGSVNGNTITIDVPVATGFGAPIVGDTLYSVTGFTFGWNNPADDLAADVDATSAFDYQLK